MPRIRLAYLGRRRRGLLGRRVSARRAASAQEFGLGLGLGLGRRLSGRRQDWGRSERGVEVGSGSGFDAAHGARVCAQLLPRHHLLRVRVRARVTVRVTVQG
jgi:hypothetical protein